MEPDIERIKEEMKEKRKNTKKKTICTRRQKNPWWFRYMTKTLMTGILLMITLILLKANPKWKAYFYDQVYNTNISFATINQMYQNYFGSPLPFDGLFKDTLKPVFHEELQYRESEKYLDGVKLTVSNHYLIPMIESGLVVFVGEKEGYGNTVIVQQVDGIDVWYGNVDNISVKLYDYVEKGSLLGESKDTNLYLVYKKDGNVLSYEEHLKKI